MEIRTRKVKSLSDIKKIRLTDYGKLAVKFNANIIAIHGGKEIFIDAQGVKETVDKNGRFLGDSLFKICDKWGHPCFVNKDMGIILHDNLMCFL